MNCDCCSETACSKNVSVPEVNRSGDKRGEESNEEIPDPIGCSGDRHALRSVSSRIHFTSNLNQSAAFIDSSTYATATISCHFKNWRQAYSPNHRTPSAGIGSYEEAGEHDHHCSRGRRVLWCLLVKGKMSHGCENHEAHDCMPSAYALTSYLITRKDLHIQIPPMIMQIRLPKRSTNHKPGNVQATLTVARMICVTKLLPRPVATKIVVP